MTEQALLYKIEQLDFFRYVDSENLKIVKEGLLNNILNKKAFFFPFGENYKNINGRFFGMDIESLTEGGAINLFNRMKPTFEKAGLKIDNVEQIFDSNTNSIRPEYKFILNGKTCKLSSVPLIPILLQGFLLKKFLKFLNKALRKDKVSERLYLINDSASDGEIAFLTKEQVKFINSLNLNPKDKPYKFTTWSIFKPIFEFIGLVLKAIFTRKKI